MLGVCNVFMVLVCVSKSVVCPGRVRVPNHQVKWVTNLYMTLVFGCVCVFVRTLSCYKYRTASVWWCIFFGGSYPKKPYEDGTWGRSDSGGK